jgi:hypothetical protein
MSKKALKSRIKLLEARVAELDEVLTQHLRATHIVSLPPLKPNATAIGLTKGDWGTLTINTESKPLGLHVTGAAA